MDDAPLVADDVGSRFGPDSTLHKPVIGAGIATDAALALWCSGLLTRLLHGSCIADPKNVETICFVLRARHPGMLAVQIGD